MLDKLHPTPECLIAGDASGVDDFAVEWAFVNGIAAAKWYACWDKFGKAAGPIRNAAMLKFGKPDLVLAFPGGAGTADMVKKARTAGVEVREVNANG